MMNNPDPAPEKKNSEKPDYKAFFQALWKKLIRNWGWKVASLVLAICLWGGLISQDSSLPRTKNFSDIKVTVTNQNILRQNGLVVVSGLDDLDPVRIKVQLPQDQYYSATADRYTVRADLSQIRSAGEQTLKLTASSANISQYGTVTEIDAPQITVQVEDYITRTRIPVQISTIGEAPTGFYAAAPVCDPMTVDIGGPSSIVENIAKVVVHYDQRMLEPIAGVVRTSIPYTVLNRDGQEVNTASLTITSQSIALRDIIVEQTLYPTMEVPISTENLVYGVPAEGYEVKSVKVIPETVTIAARDLTPFQKEGTFFYLLGRVNVTGEAQNKTSTITISSRGVEHISEETAYVTVEIGPIGQTEKAK